MKKLQNAVLLTFVLILCQSCHARDKIQVEDDLVMEVFHVPELTTQIVTNQVIHRSTGQFKLEWRYAEKCQSPTIPVMGKFENTTPSNVGNVTNIITSGDGGYYIITNVFAVYNYPCPKEHIDTTPQVETTYCQSNLFAVIELKGMRWEDCIQSICVKTNVVRYHWEKTKIIDK